MEIQEALKIMRALADGVNPETGDVLSADAVYQYATGGESAFTARWAHWKSWKNGERSRKAPPANAGKSWSRAEDAAGLRGAAQRN